MCNLTTKDMQKREKRSDVKRIDNLCHVIDHHHHHYNQNFDHSQNQIKVYRFVVVVVGSETLLPAHNFHHHSLSWHNCIMLILDAFIHFSLAARAHHLTWKLWLCNQRLDYFLRTAEHIELHSSRVHLEKLGWSETEKRHGKGGWKGNFKSATTCTQT